MKIVLNTLLLAAFAAVTLPAAAQSAAKAEVKAAQTKATDGKAAQAKPQKSKKAAKADAAEQPGWGEDDKDVDVAQSSVVEMSCAHGDKVTLYENGNDDTHIGVRWKKHLLRMERVSTTTGAQRFESKKHGLVWIGIPAKGMLLDAKKGQQLANECRSAAQLAAQANQEPAQPQIFMEARK